MLTLRDDERTIYALRQAVYREAALAIRQMRRRRVAAFDVQQAAQVRKRNARG